MFSETTKWPTNLMSLQLVVIIGCSVLSNCGSLPPRPSTQCREFYDININQRDAKIRSSSAEIAVDLYICGMHQEPPTDFAGIIAERGTEVIPILLEDMNTTNDEGRQDLVLHIFERLAEKGELRGNHKAVEELRQIVGRMKIEQIKL